MYHVPCHTSSHKNTRSQLTLPSSLQKSINTLIQHYILSKSFRAGIHTHVPVHAAAPQHAHALPRVPASSHSAIRSGHTLKRLRHDHGTKFWSSGTGGTTMGIKDGISIDIDRISIAHEDEKHEMNQS